ncbi:MAG: hypothetical protein PUC84_13645, partial [Clostridiales bacterium]|nr:hypothetical protein [Clostridiales bacterium]
RFNTTGIIAEDRKVTYDILLINYSSQNFTDVVINDTISLSNDIDISGITYVAEESMFENSDIGGLPNIQFNVGTLSQESQLIVHYTLKLSDEVPIGTVIKSKTNVNYNENTNITEDNVVTPIEANEIDLTLDYTSTKIEATKTAPSNVLCGENFDYNLIFENVGVNLATGVSILDYLPKEFVINYVKVVNGNTTLERGIDYNYDENANPLLITDTGTSLNINPGEMLVVTINGKIPYLTD